jgi:hypothetical protein
LGGSEDKKVLEEEKTVWQKDEEAKQCCLCSVQFSLITRRHHCRKCGKVVCHKCSDQKEQCTGYANAERVCDSCKDAAACTEAKAWKTAKEVALAYGSVEGLSPLQLLLQLALLRHACDLPTYLLFFGQHNHFYHR